MAVSSTAVIVESTRDRKQLPLAEDKRDTAHRREYHAKNRRVVRCCGASQHYLSQSSISHRLASQEIPVL